MKMIPNPPEPRIINEGKINIPWRRKKEKSQPIILTDEEYEEKRRKDLEEEKRIRKQVAIGILENDPELIQEILIELRKKKIKKIKKIKC